MRKLIILVKEDDVNKVIDAVLEAGVVIGIINLDAEADLPEEVEDDQKQEA